MNALTLRAIAASWLRYDKRCSVVAFERGLNQMERPDVIGLTTERLVIEIEIKISLKDFKDDGKKRKWLHRRARSIQYHHPAFMYYFVPPELVGKIVDSIPHGVGLFSLYQGKGNHRDVYTGYPPVHSIVSAVRNPLAKKLAIQDAIELVRHQTGTLCTMALAQAKHFSEKNLPESSPQVSATLKKSPSQVEQ